MSLLLDALRKSEDQRRKGELPTLDQPLKAAPVAATAPRRILMPPLLMMIVLAIVLAWWLNRPSEDEFGIAPSADSGPASSSTAGEVPPVPTSPPAVLATQSRPASSEQPAAVSEASSPDMVDAAESDANAVNEPGSSEDQDAIYGQLADMPAPVNAVPAGQAVAAAEPDTADPQPVIETQESVPETIVPNPMETAQVEQSLANETEPQAEPVEPPVSSFIYAWELPLEARQDFPDLDVAVHVFALDPASRFVLINGERYGEGDRLAPGVVLNEITREGAMVDFRNYRILLQ